MPIIREYALVGLKSGDVYYSSRSKSAVFRWLNNKTSGEPERKGRKTVELSEALRLESWRV